MGRVTAVFASRNEGKLRELRALLPDWEIEPLGDVEMPEETGATFYENAIAKARFAQSVEPGRWAIGEDSGLEVDWLGGVPGIRSARYAGEDATDEENVAKLLDALVGAEGTDRGAHYVSELVVLSPDGTEARGTGTLEGSIATEPRGSGGFGYDPVFVPTGETRTVAELGDEWKREHSHRAEATRALPAGVGEAPGAM
ncbi:MAG TPA: RdgB/HAM1 family non-canonical purine NTP pyrophosphatase [Gaiellaceae bacterium]|nr:RdgB/HAM1 family non-canonical purine NTP pyrophosphatase [Gaiellaceae bacterium]